MRSALSPGGIVRALLASSSTTNAVGHKEGSPEPDVRSACLNIAEYGTQLALPIAHRGRSIFRQAPESASIVKQEYSTGDYEDWDYRPNQMVNSVPLPDGTLDKQEGDHPKQ